MDGLEAEGWTLTYDGGDKMRVYDPSSPTGRKHRERMSRDAA